jgi:hypothetical protein
MISITCTQCQTVLTIDDAFAGGVCRCQHCGTIQTVPSNLKPSATAQPFVSPSSSKAKSLYQNESAARTVGANVATTGARSTSGLDDLAQAVGQSGSGLAGSGLSRAQMTMGAASGAQVIATATIPNVAPTPAGAAVTKKSPLMMILIGAGALILVLIGVIVFLVMGSGGTTGGGPGGGGAGGTFAGVSIAGSRVIYILDDANSISNDFDPLRAATYKSIKSLGDKKFAVILWDNGATQFAFPKDGLSPASGLDDLTAKFKDIEAAGASKLRPALERAMFRTPDAVVLVTAKSRLDDDDESALSAAMDTASGKTKFYMFTVGSAGDNEFLKALAKGNGEYHHLSSTDLNNAGG